MNPLKSSFLPISNHDAEILILGSLPGEKSLELQEYYGHAQNKFWKIIAAITSNDMPPATIRVNSAGSISGA